MRAKKTVYFFSALLLFSGLLCSVDALSDTSVSFQGGGVTIDLIFPEEAHPTDSIWHNATVTANTALKLNFTIVIDALVDSSWQEITREDKKNRDLSQSEILPISMRFTPQNANGSLRCFIYLQTNQTADDVSYTFYTTRVSELTFSEMQILYYEMLANYTALNATYTALNETFTNLSAQYETLLEQNKDLIADYHSLEATYESLLSQYNKLSEDYDDLNANYRSKITDLGDLQLDYDDLNSTRYSLQTSYNTLQAVYDALNQTYTDLQTELNNLQDRFSGSESELNINRIVMFICILTLVALIAFIVYIKRKKQEPYVVIRKETVSMNGEGS